MWTSTSTAVQTLSSHLRLLCFAAEICRWQHRLAHHGQPAICTLVCVINLCVSQLSRCSRHADGGCSFFQTTEAQYPLATCQDWRSCISLIICSCAESEGAMVPKGEIPGQWSRGFASWSEICLLDGLICVLVEPERLIPLLEADYYVFVLPFFHLIDLKDSV